MNPQDQNLNRIADIVTKGSAGVILIPTNPTPDAIAAAASLYLALTKIGKTINLVSSSSVQSDLIAADKFQSSLATAGDNLVIAFPYSEGAIDKVDYNIQGNNFNLIITPRQGYPKLNPEQVKYSYSGGLINFIITIDTPNLNSLGQIYMNNQNQFQGKDIINIDRHLTNSFYGTVNFVNKTSSSSVELIYQILQKLGVEIDKDIATNLYAGLSTATNNFTSYSVNAETFEMAAAFLKLGAIKKRVPMAQPQPMKFNSQTNPFSQQQSFSSPQMPQPQININHNMEKQTKPISTVEREPQQSDDDNKAPQDWLKPKIFRGGGLI